MKERTHQLTSKPLLRAATAATTLAMLPEGMLPITLPLLAVAIGRHASASGWLLTAVSAGGPAGTGLSGRLINAAGPRVVMAVAMAAAAPLLAALAAIPSFIPSLVLAGLFGAAIGPIARPRRLALSHVKRHSNATGISHVVSQAVASATVLLRSTESQTQLAALIDARTWGQAAKNDAKAALGRMPGSRHGSRSPS